MVVRRTHIQLFDQSPVNIVYMIYKLKGSLQLRIGGGYVGFSFYKKPRKVHRSSFFRKLIFGQIISVCFYYFFKAHEIEGQPSFSIDEYDGATNAKHYIQQEPRLQMPRERPVQDPSSKLHAPSSTIQAFGTLERPVRIFFIDCFL